MLSIQEISDRFELQDLTNRYCHLLDQGLFDELTQVFTDDAHIDYTSMGGIKGTPRQIVSFLKQVMPRFSNYQHMISNQQFETSGDKATGAVAILSMVTRLVTNLGRPHPLTYSSVGLNVISNRGVFNFPNVERYLHVVPRGY